MHCNKKGDKIFHAQQRTSLTLVSTLDMWLLGDHANPTRTPTSCWFLSLHLCQRQTLSTLLLGQTSVRGKDALSLSAVLRPHPKQGSKWLPARAGLDLHAAAASAAQFHNRRCFLRFCKTSTSYTLSAPLRL